MMRGKEFHRHTNFAFEIEAIASTPGGFSPAISGFVFHIKSTDGVES